MSKLERPADQPNHENGSTCPTLEQLFTTQNPAAIVMFDTSSRHGIDRGVSLSHLVYIYKPLFGKRKESNAYRHISLAEFNSRRWECEDYGETGDSEGIQWIRLSEASAMATLLFTPSADPEQIQQRQQLLEHLSSSENLDDLIALKNQAYNLIAGIEEIKAFYSTEPRNEVPLIDLYYKGWKKLPIFENYLSDEVVDEEEVLPLISTAVDMINAGLDSIKDLSAAVATQQNFPLQQVLSDLPSFMAGVEEELADTIPFDKAETPELKPYKASRGLNYLLREKVEPYLFRVGAVLEFAKKVRDEGWGKVSSDPNKPYGYVGGWNLEMSKDKQVCNDSPIEAPVVLLSGANTSGKSFTMKSDFLIRIARQSFGYAPVIEGNLPLCKSFVYLECAENDPENDLSVFMKEVKNLIIALPSIGSDTRLYVDEGFSTSPQDQARLLPATAKYVRRRGGNVMVATHNDILLSAAENNPNMVIYHLQTGVGDDGELIRYFILQPGVNESLALAAARARNFPRHTIKFVESYLRQETSLSVAAKGYNYPVIKHFSEKQREERKRQSQTLESLFPNDSEKSVFHLFSLDPDFSVKTLLQHLMPNEDTFSFTVFEPVELREMLGRMIMRSPELSSAEILERQKLFGELLRGENYRDIHKMIEKIGFLEETFAMVARYAKEGINKGLNPFQREEPEKIEQADQHEEASKKIQFTYKKLQVATAFLSIQQKLLGNDFRFTNLLEDATVLTNAFNTAKKEHPERIYDESELLTEEQTKTFEHLIETLRDIKSALPSVPFEDIRFEDIREELTILEKYKRGGEQKGNKKSGMEWYIGESIDLDLGGLPYAVQKLHSDLESAENLVAQLKTTDSVYLHQAANFIQQRIDKYRAILQRDASEEEEDSSFRRTIKQLDALCLFAGIIQDKDLTSVDFNETGEVRLLNAFSIFKKKEKQVRNSVSLNAENERIELLTGPNGSGKTFYEKGVIGSVLMGLATGYAPAENATMPVFDAVVYFDHMVKKQDVELSTFSQQLEYWKKLLYLLQAKKSVFAAVDEGPSTSPQYQAAFIYALVAEFLQSNHFLMLSTHNHDVVERLMNAQTGLINPYHFQFTVTKDGKVIFHHTKREGHEISHAVEVARTMGLPEEITSS